MRRSARISQAVAASLAAAVALTVYVPSARADTSDTLNANAGGSRAFTLTAAKESERVQFDQPRDLRLCNETQRTDTNQVPPPGIETEPATDRPVPTHDAPVGLRVSYADQTTEIAPGECATMTAQELTVSPTEPLEGDATLMGTVSSNQIEVPVRGERMGKANELTLRTTIAEIRHMIERDDATELATKAEFDRAHDQLQQAAAKLSEPEVAQR